MNAQTGTTTLAPIALNSAINRVIARVETKRTDRTTATNHKKLDRSIAVIASMTDADLIDVFGSVDRALREIDSAAIYALEKITDMVSGARFASDAVALGQISGLHILLTANAYRAHRAVTNDELHASSAQVDAKNDSVLANWLRKQFAAGTITTQRSTTCIALNAVQLAQYDSRAKLTTFNHEQVSVFGARWIAVLNNASAVESAVRVAAYNASTHR